MQFRTKYSNESDVKLIRETYSADNSTALLVVSPTEGPLCTATVCLDEYGETPSEGHVFIKTWSENEGVYEALLDAGVIGEYVRKVPAGFATALECPLLWDGSDT